MAMEEVNMNDDISACNCTLLECYFCSNKEIDKILLCLHIIAVA